MKNLMNQLYGLTNLAMLTPQNLVENIQLESYLEIKYYRKHKEIICEMTVEEEHEIVSFIYSFSMNNQLQRAYAICDGENIDLFDRSKELDTLLDEYDRIKEASIVSA